jgi:hypothetical protein
MSEANLDTGPLSVLLAGSDEIPVLFLTAQK